MKPSLSREITFLKDTLARLPEKIKVFHEETDNDVPNNQEQSFLHNFLIVCIFFTVYIFNLYLIIGFLFSFD